MDQVPIHATAAQRAEAFVLVMINKVNEKGITI
jgi:hypothetical protein